MAGTPPLPAGAVPITPPLPAGAVPIGAAPPLPKGAVPIAPQPTPSAQDPLLTPDRAISMADLKSKYEQNITQSAKRWNVDPNMVRAVHFVEDTSEDPNAKSNTGALGEMQFMPETWKRFAEKGASITNAAQNIDAGAHYLSYLTSLYGGNLDKVFTAYNAGDADEQLRKECRVGSRAHESRRWRARPHRTRAGR